MKTVINYLTQLGFSTIETKIYLKLLSSGSMTVAELAEAAKINRTAAYSYINSLLDKGIIAKAKGSANKIVANPPEQLHILVEQKAIQVGMLQEKLPSIVSVLNSALPRINSPKTSEIKYYKGRAGAKVIYEECLKADEIRTYFNGAELEKVFPENFQLFDNALKYNSRLKMYEILEDSPESRKQMDVYSKTDGYFYKFFPRDVKLLANDILIFEGKVAIINLGDINSITGVILSNPDYYNNSVQLFDLLWRLLPETNQSN